MDLLIKVSDHMCMLDRFEINGIIAQEYEFGELIDDRPDLIDCEGGCGNRVFEPYDNEKDIMEKYNLSHDDYCAVIKELEKKLNFGKCCLCN